MFLDQIPKKLKVFWNSTKFQKNLEFSKIPKISRSGLSPQIFLEFWNFGKLEFFFGILVLQRISHNIFGILDNSVVCNLSVSFVLNCSHVSIICFHLLIRSVHFLNRSSYLRTTFLLHSYLLDFYFPFTYLHISAFMLYY